MQDGCRFNAVPISKTSAHSMDLVRRTLQRYIEPTDPEWLRILPCWKEFRFPRRSSICAAGKVENHFYIVREGVQRLSFAHDGEDICVGFSYAGSWSGEYASFVTRKPARFDVVAMTDSILLGITHEDLQQLYHELPVMERFGRLILEEVLVGRGVREVELLSLTAEERYRRLVARSPHLLQLVPQKDIASYLRMTPETFSRLRRTAR